MRRTVKAQRTRKNAGKRERLHADRSRNLDILSRDIGESHHMFASYMDYAVELALYEIIEDIGILHQLPRISRAANSKNWRKQIP